MANETLRKLEEVLLRHNQRPCDFWDEIKRAKWDDMLNKLEPLSIEEIEQFLINEGYV